MVEGSNKRKKFHDKDKYYRLAKEQGLRSRAAFKLTQINRKFGILQNAKTVLDLCAAPGGWTQICQKSMPTQDTLIVAVDLLPIRRLGKNVVTLIGDITTDSCKALIRSTLQQHDPLAGRKKSSGTVDVVLHDGAPNVGASYERDAYVQNEMALHALKCATQHLKDTGCFVTKLYRSRDYASYVYVCQQFFGEVQAVKPTASRLQSAEIFLVCQQYKGGPNVKMDPRWFDPKHVFEHVEGETTGGGNMGSSSAGGGTSKTFNVFHKQWDQQKRHREGYDMSTLDATMRHVQSVQDFLGLDVNPAPDPIALLSTCTGFSFTCATCSTKAKEGGKDSNKEEEEKAAAAMSCSCRWCLEHSLTTAEIKACLTDLKVLNKSDFKSLLTWRTKLRQAYERKKEAANKKKESVTSLQDVDETMESDDDNDHDKTPKKKGGDNDEDEEDEEKIQAEIAQMRQRRLREQKKLKKKDRAMAAKQRQRAALGMHHNAIELPDHDAIFSLATITNQGELEAVSEVNLDKVTDQEAFGCKTTLSDEEEDDGVHIDGIDVDDDASEQLDEETGYSYRLDRELDDAYDRYLRTTKNGTAKSGTKMAKRSKKVLRQKAMQEAEEDEELLQDKKASVTYETKTYAEMLQGPKDSDDEDDGVDSEEEEDDGFNDEPLTPEEHAARKLAKANATAITTKKSERNPLIHLLPDDPASVKTARWFSNPLFESMGQAAQLASLTTGNQKKRSTEEREPDFDSEDDDEADDAHMADGEMEIGDDEEDDRDVEAAAAAAESDEESDDPSPPPPPRKIARKAGDKTADRDSKKGKKKEASKAGLSADDVLAMIPKTDKQIRHERRLKALEREERKKERKARKLGKEEEGFEIAPARGPDDDDDDHNIVDEDAKLHGLNEKQRKRVLEARELIKAGLGTAASAADEPSGFEVVAAEEPLPKGLEIMDSRRYDSENEDYDSDDYARTLALGTMMLRKSKEKSLVDASYNRFAWNDPEGLPDWFVDDENKHYRPQLPIPPALLAKMKEKMAALSVRPIAKVAEARARKAKRARVKLTAAKKKAEQVVNSSDMTETMKLKAISKAMRGQEVNKPAKTFVVAKKGRSVSGGKGVAVVDKRQKKDKRGMERAEKKRKGKGSTGGSKRKRR